MDVKNYTTFVEWAAKHDPYTADVLRLIMNDLIGQYEGQYECVDNVRFATVSDPEEVAAYELAVAQGCCGSVDRAAVIDGRVYLFGFNHGH